MHPLRVVLLAFGWLLLTAGYATADQFKTFDNYEVHYSAFNSSFLTPEVAAAYDIQRSEFRALLNIAVLNKEDASKPVKATVSGSLKNLLGQTRNLSFNEVNEGEAIYYITSFRFTDDERLMFDINVQADDNQVPFSLQFDQQFYRD